MATNWTNAQLDAIGAKGSVMVTAAAGSGKTAVLVERVISKLCDPVNPIPADRLLIVTFTRAAAAEMRQRIEKALSERCAAEPDNIALLRQQLLISSADICTIDSFCIKLVRNHFDKLGISPDFAIADRNTEREIHRTVMSELFEERFQNNSEDFIAFLQATDSVYGDQNAANAVGDLYEFCQKLSQPNLWLKTRHDEYSDPNQCRSAWIFCLCKRMQEELPNLKERILRGIDLLESDEVLGEKWLSEFLAAGSFVTEVLSATQNEDYDKICELFNNINTVLPRVSGKKYDRLHITEAKALFQSFKDWVAFWEETCKGGTERLNDEITLCKTPITQLIELCIEFSKRYFNALTEQSLLTFSLTEQLALELLTTEAPNGKLIPSQIAKQVCDLYDEVMVDEFQDVNDLQSTLFEMLSDGGKKLFTVGDAKQSIYGFRGANPEHFLKKGESAKFYSPELSKETNKRVVLSKNFRSRASICDFINSFFGMTMSKGFGGIDYDENEMLFPGANYPTCELSSVETHILQLTDELSGAETEAYHLADYIEQTIKGEPFLREDSTKLKAATYGDFAVLFRKSNHFPVFVKILKERGIPVALGYGNFFETTEIMTVLSLLRAIDRPLDDIAMLAVMLSPIFGFTEEEVALLKKEHNNDRFYRAILKSDSKDKKISFLREKLSFWREKAACMQMGDFVSLLLNDSGYSSMVLSMTEPERRQNNLILLEEISAGFSKDKAFDLSALIRQLDCLSEQDDTKSQTAKSTNAVRLMTMHMSKGLQFPITIIADCFALFNRKDIIADIAFSQALGIGMNPVCDEKNEKVITLAKTILNKELLRKQWEEELRLLYVAMTRAEERLVFFLTASSLTRKLERTRDRLICYLDSSGHLDPAALRATGNIGDWLLMFLMTLPICEDISNEIEGFIQFLIPTHRNLNVKVVKTEVFKSEVKKQPSLSKDVPTHLDWFNQVKNIFSYKYPYEQLREIETKTSVSALTKRNAGREFCAIARPAFLSAGGLTPTERGTALHKFMQYADFSLAKEDPLSEIERLYSYEFITRAEADAIDVERVRKFFATDLFARILAADNLYREQRFLLSVLAGEIYSDLSDTVKDQEVIIQGAVDCMFIEGDHIVLIDFKTDRTNDETFLLTHYAEQLRTYCHAAEKMFSLPVKECYLYSLHMSKKILVPLDKK